MSRDDVTVLVVEDQERLADAYTAVIGRQYDVRTAYGGEEALDKADDEVDIVLLDRRMPGMSGDEVLAEFVERGLTVQVVMLTAVEPDTDIVDMPFDDYVTKPVDNDELLNLVDILCQRRELDEQCQEFFRLAAKKRALERADRETTPEYRSVSEDMESIRATINNTLEELAADASFPDIIPTK